MRATFQGGACDGHSHSVGPTPPETLKAPCRSAVRGRYVRTDMQTGDDRPNGIASEPDTFIYIWQPGEPQANPTISRLSSDLGLDVETE